MTVGFDEIYIVGELIPELFGQSFIAEVKIIHADLRAIVNGLLGCVSLAFEGNISSGNLKCADLLAIEVNAGIVLVGRNVIAADEIIFRLDRNLNANLLARMRGIGIAFLDGAAPVGGIIEAFD